MDEVVAVLLYKFDDDSGAAQELGRVTREAMTKMIDAVPGFTYSGDKKVKEAKVGLMSSAEFDSF